MISVATSIHKIKKHAPNFRFRYHLFLYINPVRSPPVNSDTGIRLLCPPSKLFGSCRTQQSCEFLIFTDCQVRMLLQILHCQSELAVIVSFLQKDTLYLERTSFFPNKSNLRITKVGNKFLCMPLIHPFLILLSMNLKKQDKKAIRRTSK